MMDLKVKDLRNFVSRIDRISICHKETLNYENHSCMHKVPDKYDDYYVYGIGIIESEVYEDGKLANFKPHLEIMVSEITKESKGE